MAPGWHQTWTTTVGGNCSHHCTILATHSHQFIDFCSNLVAIRVADNQIHEFITPEPDVGHYPFILGANSNDVR